MGTQGGMYCDTYVEVREQLVGVRSSTRWPVETNSDHQLSTFINRPSGATSLEIILGSVLGLLSPATARVLLRNFSKTFPLKNMIEGFRPLSTPHYNTPSSTRILLIWFSCNLSSALMFPHNKLYSTSWLQIPSFPRRTQDLSLSPPIAKPALQHLSWVKSS